MKIEYCRYIANIVELAAMVSEVSEKYGKKIALDVSYSSNCGCFELFVAKDGNSPFGNNAIFQKSIFFNYPNEDIIVSFEEMQKFLISLLSKIGGDKYDNT